MNATPAVHPLIPEDAKPKACRRLGCVIIMETMEVGGVDGVVFRHANAGRQASFVIPMTSLDNPTKYIWGEVKPWLESLHDEPSACPTCGKPR